ncbi:uncharacterized protein LOC105556608 [Rhizophagus clarus]|uniref:Uncharacterized protein LOC105556608 n=1 Tax=Rhizophagus clarus TaxID=94130 RepID=A0A8H3L7J8_9GLOM|nr:uncharacterized protein LOC105556608 [Rhizophagus clarus]
MHRPSEKCLQGALGCYFADKAGKTDHLGRRIFRAKSLHQYLDTVKLNGIPMPTPICPHIFDKIEKMNPDIAINVWRWNEESATPKPIIAKLHLEWCPGLHENAPQRVAIPVKGVNDFEEFKNYGRMINAPYSHDRFLETELPLYHEFYSTLKGKITLGDYQHAQKVWKEFKCQNLGEYHDLYLKTDVLSLANVWTEFRKMSMKYYDQYLPIGNYKWGTSRGYLLKNLAMQKKLLDMALKIKPDAKRGYYLNINSHFPLKTHDYLSDLPPAVENIAVEKDWLYPYNAKLVE